MNVRTSTILLLLIAIIFLHQQGIAGTTGKLSGIIRDVTTTEPVVGANVTLKGTLIGASSDIEGSYSILNIPPGVYSVVISMVGYQQVQYDNVVINVDLTTTLDVMLQQTAIEIGAQIITAERPIVSKDMTGSMSTVGSREISSLPVQQIQQVLRLSAGIVEANGRLHIRGGRAGEVAYWVDGISATDMYDGRIGVAVENSAVQELQVISGTFNAEYGQAMSGIVNLITKEGGDSYVGQIKVYAGDYVSNSDKFSLYKRVDTDEEPGTRREIVDPDSTERDFPLKNFNPIYNAEFSLSGPVPLIGGSSLTFFANGRYFYDEGYFYGRNWFKPNGNPGDNSLVALNPNETKTILGKLNYKLSNQIKVGYNVYWNESKRERNYFRANSIDYQFNVNGQANFNQFNSHDYKYVPYGIPQFNGYGLTNTFTLNHVLSQSTFYELRASRYYSESKQFVYENPLQAAVYIAQVDSANNTTYVVAPNSPDGYINPTAISQPATASFFNKGMDITHTERSSQYLVGKLDVTTQVDKKNQVKAGAEIRKHELTLHSFQIIPAVDANGVELTPFKPQVPDISSIYRSDYNRQPWEASLYLQDKMEFQDVILNVGLRYDYFDANAKIPADPEDPNIFNPFKTKNMFDVNGDGSINNQDNQAAPSAVAKRRAYWYKTVKPKMALSPRFGISFPITDKGIIHFSYGHFLQIPEFQYLYTNPDFKISSSTNNAIMGNPDLRPQKTVQYEIGLQQQLSDVIGIDVSLFYRDIRDWVGTSRPIQTAKTSVQYSRYENKDYSNVKGITFKLEKRFSNNYSFRVDYTLQSAEGTYTDPIDEFNSLLSNQQPALSLIPLGFDRRHTLNAQFIYDLSGWKMSLIGRYFTGQPYTPSFTVAEAVGASGVSGLIANSARRPDQKTVDLTVSKMLPLFSSITFEVFVNVYNLFDQRDHTNVYGDTGSADYTTQTNLNPNQLPYNVNRVSTIADFVNQPAWYTAPRQIQAGVGIGF